VITEQNRSLNALQLTVILLYLCVTKYCQYGWLTLAVHNIDNRTALYAHFLIAKLHLIYIRCNFWQFKICLHPCQSIFNSISTLTPNAGSHSLYSHSSLFVLSGFALLVFVINFYISPLVHKSCWLFVYVGVAFCLFSLFCAFMMGYFDKRAERILAKKPTASGN